MCINCFTVNMLFFNHLDRNTHILIADFTDYLPCARPVLNSLYFIYPSRQIFEVGAPVTSIIQVHGEAKAWGG